MIFVVYRWPFPRSVAVMLVESSITWLLVSTRPSELITMPVPAACSLLYCSVVLMMTRPGSTLLRIAVWLAFPAAPPPLLGCGIAVLGIGAGAVGVTVGCGAAAAVFEVGW